ncbi:hypothetical protein TREMEDRAFT_59372 [Tremella mesenterica DSM 1558]|uniref:uncharacterized protein n=1 Tax=Tremella mesenterica (strain ATCC 24925 / CBS 8224 / DSM 1558 / NBRC 9311 / NRRL Y-6157 / RJB 2259-6 / UBC 559-6) TaxID=578456 RepID=UPI0003F493BE|nr:uncharacterized protein TREMEDRAFT_59372 [Tremella mesenterica DSM 1558]EIW73209.1 hypothetical protein TREMEDRAFT_59372 [Tremella mesenterica DSM 1558]
MFDGSVSVAGPITEFVEVSLGFEKLGEVRPIKLDVTTLCDADVVIGWCHEVTRQFDSDSDRMGWVFNQRPAVCSNRWLIGLLAQWFRPLPLKGTVISSQCCLIVIVIGWVGYLTSDRRYAVTAG